MARTALLIALPVATLVAIYLLARQSTQGTQDLAWRAEQWLLRHVPPTGIGDIGEPTWCGLTIRRIAHIVEYGLLGLTVSALLIAVWGCGLRAAAVTAAACLVASVADEAHKTLVPGRHFDAYDLLLDAAGYLPALALAHGLAFLLTHAL